MMEIGVVFRAAAAAGVSLMAGAGTAAAGASVSDACPDTMAQAQAMLERQGRLPGAWEANRARFSPAGLTVLGAAPAALYLGGEPNVIWSFAYELPVNYTLNLRRAFETSPPRIAGYTHDCPANSQCQWRASGFGNAGPQPQHGLGQLLVVDLRSSYSNPGTYSLACRYLNRRPVRP